MRQYIDKLKKIGRELTKEYGPLNLFAFSEREDLNDKWDVLISVSPIPKNVKEFINDLIKRFQKELLPSELVQISRFVFLEPNHPVVQHMNMFAHVENSDIEIRNSSINNVKIWHAIVLSSTRDSDKNKGPKKQNKH
jgi:hypothetical protein